MPLLYTFGQLTLGTFMMLGWRPRVEGLENIPKSGGAIFAGNHLSVADELFLGSVIKRHLAFWAKEEYFNQPFSRLVMRGLGTIKVERSGGRAALAAFDGAIPVLKSGDLVAVYPEGTRSPDGRLYRGRTGAARLAVAAGVPIIPVGMIGTDKVQPIGQPYPKPFRGRGEVVIKFGKPLDVTGRADDRSALRELTDELMAEIQKLTGQEYVPRYAPSKNGGSEAG